MRRAAAILACLLVLAGAVTTLGSGDPSGRRYVVELDTGTGLVDGGDFKIGGVRAGVIERLRLDRTTKRALAEIRIDDPAVDGLRSDARCEVRPQSLLGEYFLDCDPGVAPRRLPEGARLGVDRTSSTIPPDLVTNVLRRPYAERLRLIVNALGAGVAGNGDRLNDALRRSVPAIRDTDRVLALLARQERSLDALTRDADAVLHELAVRKHDVGRFVRETGRAAGAAASRREDLRAAVRDTPRFLAELTPTMSSLADLAQAGAPALADTRASAPELERSLTALPAVADASRPALRTLGKAAHTGRPLVAPTRDQVRLLRAASMRAPETFGNLAIVLEHLDDRDNAVEDDPRSPGGKGFTGFEGLMRYLYYQGTVLNSFDAASHTLNASLFESRCAFYREPADLQADPSLAPECGVALGPNQPGITTPDPSAPRAGARRRRTPGPERGRPAPPLVPDGPRGTPATPSKPSTGPTVPLIDLGGLLEDVVPPGLLPDPGALPGVSLDPRGQLTEPLLDYLLGS